MNEPETIADLLASSQVIAVVGLTDNPSRPAYGVSAYLMRAGYTVVPVGPDAEVLGQTGYPDLPAVPFPVDVVDIFRRADRVLPHVQEAIEIGARGVWLQLGIRNPEAEKLAEQAGLKVVADRCTKIEHADLVAQGRLSAR